ncbi:hypothetical protein ACQV9O_26835, partial [Ralstonia pseudosolanacearum]|uniref:hypothetical protein n=1 Tax=Ralstonia pseudosolanacearum TaxID=1310165 RepID=UPI003D2AFEB4
PGEAMTHRRFRILTEYRCLRGVPMTRTAFLIAACLLAAKPAAAQPSDPFYLYYDSSSGTTVCAQYAQSSNWIQRAGPFVDADCKMPKLPDPVPAPTLPANPLDLTPASR